MGGDGFLDDVEEEDTKKPRRAYYARQADPIRYLDEDVNVTEVEWMRLSEKTP